MSQSRVRKMLSSGAEMPRARTSTTKASGDTMACPIRLHHDTLPSRSKNKIPKSVRYDLDNALVGVFKCGPYCLRLDNAVPCFICFLSPFCRGFRRFSIISIEIQNMVHELCDVWFEEIKPHLVRNKIKLHVNGSSAGGDHERPPPTNAAPARAPPPSLRAPGCSHLDPGAAPDHLRRAASCVGSSSTPPIVSSARCARLRMPRRRPLSPLLSVPQTPRDCPQIQSVNCEEKKLERHCIRRKHRRFQTQLQASWRVPRLCRTYTVLSQAGAAAGSRTTMTASHRPPQPARDDYYRFIVPRRESVMKNKTTQTKEALCVSRGCQSSSPKRSSAPRSPKRSSAPRSPKRSSAPRSPKRNSAPRSPTCISDPISPTCDADSISPDCASPPLIVPPYIICQLRQPEATVAEIPPLLQDDLIDIIAEGNERRLRLLYSSSDKDNHLSFMNLVPKSPQEKRGLKKLPPWR